MADASKLRVASEEIEKICNEPGSRSNFYRYGGVGYKYSLSHYFQSSSEAAYSAVEPGDEADLIKIVNVIKTHKVPFAIKGGGHTTNANFSSTKGIQISMVQFNRVNYDLKGVVTIGAGCIFDEVYRDEGLKDARQNIVGGSDIEGVGVAGWLLGGGYSMMKTNRFGLGIDSVKGYRVVVPRNTGQEPTLEIVQSDDQDQYKKELFWALKGGGNNFGIVTEFTLRTHLQGRVYSGTLTYNAVEVEDVKKAILNFLEKSDKRATIKAVFRHDNTPRGRQFKLLVFCFYDIDEGDIRPIPDPFQEFLDIDHTGKLEETSGFPGDIPTQPLTAIGENVRGRWGCVMLGKYTAKILDTIFKQAEKGAEKMSENNGKMFAIGCKPFIQGMFDDISPDSKANGAWPHKMGEANHPLLVYAEWEDDENDDFWISEMKRVLDVLSRTIPPNSLPVYSNTALAEHTEVEDIYRGNLERLQKISKTVDPAGVMSLAGGFKIPAVHI